MSVNINLNTNIIADESIELKKIQGYEKLVHSDDLEHTHDVEIETIDEIDGEFVGTQDTTDVSSGEESINSITKTNELPVLNLSCNSGTLQISFTQGTQVEFEQKNVASKSHVHKYTPSGNTTVTFKKSKKQIETNKNK